MYGFHFLKWVTKNIELFHDILIFWDVPVFNHLAIFTVMAKLCEQVWQENSHLFQIFSLRQANPAR